MSNHTPNPVPEVNYSINNKREPLYREITKNAYVCPDCKQELNEVDAMNYGTKCACGEWWFTLPSPINITSSFNNDGWHFKPKPPILNTDVDDAVTLSDIAAKAMNRSRPHGKTLFAFQEFQKAIEAGKSAEWHGPDYVVMSRDLYNKLRASRQATIKEVVEQRFKDVRRSEVDYLRSVAQNDERLTADEYEAILLILNDRLAELESANYGRPATWEA